MQIHAGENKGFFPGGPGSSVRQLFNPNGSNSAAFGRNNCPDVIRQWDSATPVARFRHPLRVDR
jgi:hypothetical protein